MALINCSECGSKVSSNAVSCPHCGNPIAKIENLEATKFSDTDVVQIPVKILGNAIADNGEVIAPKNVTFLQAVSVIVIGIIIVAFMVSSGSSSSGGVASSNADSQGEAIMANIKCQNFVKERLKAPASADFPLMAEHMYREGNKYRAVSYVDAQNSFGAHLRNTYSCQVEWNGQDSSRTDNWTLIDLQMDE